MKHLGDITKISGYDAPVVDHPYDRGSPSTGLPGLEMERGEEEE